MILVISVNIWLTFFLWLSLLSCGYTTFQYFILFKRKNCHLSWMWILRQVIKAFFFLASPYMDLRMSLLYSWTKGAGPRPALGTRQLLYILDFGNKLRYTLAESKGCIFTAVVVFFFFFFRILFIYLRKRERERACTSMGRGRKRRPTEQGAGGGARSQDPRIMTWVEGRCLTHWAPQVSPRAVFLERHLVRPYSVIKYLQPVRLTWIHI